MNEGGQHPGPRQSQAEIQRRQFNANKVIKNLVGEMTYTVLFIIAIVLVLSVDKNENLPADKTAKYWLTVILGYYIVEFIMQMT